jgi:hypothetical protein
MGLRPPTVIRLERALHGELPREVMEGKAYDWHVEGSNSGSGTPGGLVDIWFGG